MAVSGRMHTGCAAVLLAALLLPPPAWALTTVNVVNGNYVIPAGETRADLKIRLLDPAGSVVLEAGAVLKDSVVDCAVLGHRTHGVVLNDGARLEVVKVSGYCGGDGVHATGARGVRFWQGEVAQMGGAAVRYVDVLDGHVFGVMVHTSIDGLSIEGVSAAVVVQGSVVYVVPGGRGISLGPGVTDSQVVRSRARQSHGVIMDVDGVNLLLDCVDDGNVDLQQGDPAAFTPRWWTVCGELSSQGLLVCDFATPQEALAVIGPGDYLSIDTLGRDGWGDLVVDVPGVTLVGVGGRRQGHTGAMKGNYAAVNRLDSLTVTAAGVHVQNFVVSGVMAVEPDTTLVWVD